MVAILPPTPKIDISYRKSTYIAGQVRTRIGRFPQGITEMDRKKTWVMLSAYNPGGRLKVNGWNLRMMNALKERLSRYNFIEGEGRLGEHFEPLVMVAIAPAQGKKLARLFRQNAIVILRHQRQTRLIYLV
ncbi:MAG: DUF3293 domain-containing protein [Commensalibacter sp.]